MSLRKQSYLMVVPLAAVLLLGVTSSVTSFLPLIRGLADVQSDHAEVVLGNELMNALSLQTDASLDVVAGTGDERAVKMSARRVQQMLSEWSDNNDEIVAPTESTLLALIGRNSIAVREASRRAFALEQSGRIEEARAIVRREVWPLAVSSSDAIGELAMQEGLELTETLAAIEKTTGSAHFINAGRLHDAIYEFRMELVARQEASKLARGVIREQTAFRYAALVGVESLKEISLTRHDSNLALTALEQVMERDQDEENLELIPQIRLEHRRFTSASMPALDGIGTESVPANADTVSAERLLGLVEEYLTECQSSSDEAIISMVSTTREALLVTLIAAALMLTVGIGVPSLFVRRIVLRIMRLQQSTASIRDGHLDIHLEASGLDEMSELAASFNEMASNLAQAAAARRQSDERFRCATLATNDVIWDWNLGTNVVWIDEASKQLLGLDQAGGVPIERWRQLIHPQDRERVSSGLQAILNGDGQQLWSDEYRLRQRDGSYAYVFDRAFIARDASGLIIRVVGAIVDVTPQKVSQQTIAALNRQKQLLLDSVADAILGVDVTGRVTFANPAGLTALGDAVSSVVGHDVHDVVHGMESEHQREACPIYAAVRCGSAYSSGDEHFRHADGHTFAAELALRPMLDEDGGIVGGVMRFRDVTEKRALERMKSEFVSTVSHELRTPLTSIRGALGLLAGGMGGQVTSKGQRMLEIAVSNTDRLVRLINDILDVEKLDEGHVVMDRATLDADEMVRQASDVMKPMADKAGVTLRSNPSGLKVLADPDRITQTLTNLISNAIKFSSPGSRVEVITNQRQGMVQFDVRDQGRGIPADKLEIIFERFQQVDASDSRQKGGSGLGLAICRGIVNQHGGRIWVESELDRGSTFSFTLPLGAEQASEPRPVTSSARTFGAPPVLVCDQDASFRAVVSELLESHGYSVAQATSGEEALTLAQAHRPIAMVLALKMDGMSGWETMAAFREGESTRDVPILIASAYSPSEARNVRGACTDDPDAYFQKPIDERLLLESLDRLAAHDSHGSAILIVEDDADLAGVMRESFERHGITTHCAATGTEAIKLVGRFHPRLVVLDVGLPEMDAFGIVEWMRERPDFRNTPLVVYSGMELSIEQRRSLQLGPTSFFTKSRIAPEQFETRVVELLRIMTAKDGTAGLQDAVA